MFDARFRTAVDKAVSPAGQALRRTGVSPDHLTATGILMSIPAAWAIATGRLIIGMLLLIASALPDLFDGSLARASGRASPRGAFFDSVGDRISDTVVLAGIAWYAQDRFGHHAALVPLAVLGVSQLVSYIRAKADTLGIDAKGGLMERGERVVVLCFALEVPGGHALAALGDHHPVVPYCGATFRKGLAPGRPATGTDTGRAGCRGLALEGLARRTRRARGNLVGQGTQGPRLVGERRLAVPVGQ